MSLQKLSTELDGQIASSLLGDTKALSAFSKTNKYYRGIAEPYLFKNIEVAANDVETSLRLLFTLLDRKELALYIGSLTYTQPVRRQEVTNRSLKQEKLRSDVWKYQTAIQDRMDEVLFPVSEFQRRPLPYRISAVLGLEWRENEGPFQSLWHLNMNGAVPYGDTVMVLPAFRTLEIRVRSFRPFSTASMFEYPSVMPKQPVLRRIQLTGANNITPAAVQKMVNNPAMSNLRELVVVGCGKGRRWQPDGIQEDGLVELLRSLEKHTPLLELLQWSNQESNRPEGHPQFDTFRDIKHLRKLHVDFGLLVPHKDTKLKCLSDPHAVFPAHLEHLTLDCFNTDKLHKLVSTFNETVEKAEDMSETEALQANLTILVALFSPLRHLSLIVPMETRNESMNTVTLHELDPVDIVFFRYAADELHKLGVTLEVFSRKGGYEKEKKLLVKKGWTASLPQYLE
ncbi:hypothetical protein J4E85_011662 [Alternaria conjuncta]|uniref:uncharacterized protein n=1 Tax=Alternaria conjuncta TaxID=181017 RepID=UPI00221FD054|nr:uncharacterized protein J4E85_011662 [Alternaria conjuncta]KAI4909010.1 hypothetical protein J4E85_011662 [Alternaria conjuncta]